MDQDEFDERTRQAIELFHVIANAANQHEWRLAFLSGFAIDAHLGRLTRAHADVDVMLPEKEARQLAAHLESAGHHVDEPEELRDECLKVNTLDPEKPMSALCDIHFFYEEKGKAVIPLAGKKLAFSAPFAAMVERKNFLGESVSVLKPAYLLEEKIGWCEQVGLDRCRTEPEVYASEIEKIKALAHPAGLRGTQHG